MGLLETFNFDIVIIIMFVSGVFFGMYYGFYRQVRKTLSVILPFIGLYFALGPVFRLIQGIGLYQTIIGYFVQYVGYVFPIRAYEHTISALIVAIILYVVFYFIVLAIVQMVGPSASKLFFEKKDAWSKALGALLSLFSSYTWIAILVYVLSPFVVIEAKNKISNFMIDSTIEIFEVSKLYDYQVNNGKNYTRYTNAETHLSLEVLNELVRNWNELSSILDEINASLLLAQPNFHADTIVLLDGQVTAARLFDKVDNEWIYETVAVLEDSNPNMVTVIARKDELLAKVGFVKTLLETSEMTEDNAFIWITQQFETASSYFEDTDKEEWFSTIQSYILFYLEYKEDLFSLITHTTVTSVEEYYLGFNEMSSDDALLNEYMDAFLEEFETSTNPILQNGVEMMTRLSLFAQNVGLIPDYLSLSARSILATRYEEWYVSTLWQHKALLHSYMRDALKEPTLPTHKLYVEYLASKYLFPELTKDGTIEEADIVTFISELAGLVDEGYISEEMAIQIAFTLFVATHAVFEYYFIHDMVSLDALLALKNATSPYITQEIKNLLP